MYMKKVISRLIIILFLAALTFLGYYGYRGYVMYQDTMEEKSLTVRVEELRSKITMLNWSKYQVYIKN